MIGSLFFSSFSSGSSAASYELISTTILGSPAASVTFSGLGTSAAAYKHLQIRGMARTTTNTGYTSAGIRFNGDTGNNYSGHELVGSNGAMSSGGGANANAPSIWRISGGSLNANIFGSVVLDILDFSNTSKNKTVRSLSGMEGGSGNTLIQLTSAAWYNTSAITSITFIDASAGNFATGSRFSLYGVKG